MSRDFSGTSRNFGGVQKVRAHFAFPILGSSRQDGKNCLKTSFFQELSEYGLCTVPSCESVNFRWISS